MNRNTRKGSSLIIAMIMSIIIISLSSSAIFMAITEQRYTYTQANKLKSRYAAESGLAEGVKYIKNECLAANLNYLQIDVVLDPSRITDPIEREEKVITVNNQDYIRLFSDKPLNAYVNVGEFPGTKNSGKYFAATRILGPTDINTGKDMTGNAINSVRYVLLTSVGQFPQTGPNIKTTTFKVVYEISTEVGKIFDYSYFINNWGWFFGDNIHCKGNARSNGSFSMTDGTKNYRPILQGRPRYENRTGVDLLEYIDDNYDGKRDGMDGGIYAWNEIVGYPSDKYGPANLYAGLKGKNQKPAVPQIPMPNLSNLSYYEGLAKEKNGSIEIIDPSAPDGKRIIFSDGVWGDNESAKNLYLEGSAEKPIKINGIVVVKGDLIIRGYVTGQGTIYCGRNVYIPQRILYKNPPVTNNVNFYTSLRLPKDWDKYQYRDPNSNTEADRESWLASNQNKDLLGLFAKENIVLGDFTDTSWLNEVNKTLSDPRNKSEEDLGIDQIPDSGDTHTGENNGVWDVERDAGGNVIAGSGEDYDGDATPDGPAKKEDFYLQAEYCTVQQGEKILSGQFFHGHPDWGGNIPENADRFQAITYWDNTNMGKPSDAPLTLSYTENSDPNPKLSLFPQIDAILYTNHLLAGYIKNQYVENGFVRDGDNYLFNNSSLSTMRGTYYVAPYNKGEIVFHGSVISRNDAMYYTAKKKYFCHDDRLTGETGESLGMVIPRVWKELQPISMSIE